MKRRTAVVLLVFSLCSLLCACKAPFPPPFEPQRTLRLDLTLETGGKTLKGKTEIHSPDDLRFVFFAPDGGIYCVCRCSETGLTCTPDLTGETLSYEDLPDDAPMKLLPLCLRAAIFTQTQFTKSGDGYVCEVSPAGIKAALVFTPEGLPKTLTAGELKVTFEKETEPAGISS